MGTKIARYLLFALLVIAPLISPAARAQLPNGQNRISYEGTLGQSHIGLTLLMQEQNAIGGGHYFYARYMTDIPLSGSMEQGAVTLQGDDGGSFNLKFKGNGSEGNKPMDFTTSVGLVGTWTKDGQSLPVTLGMRDLTMTAGRWYEDVTNESDAAFEAKARGFYQAVTTGDRSGAARYTSFPLRVNQNGKSRMIRSAAELSAQWEHIFTPAYLEELKKHAPHDMSIVKGEAMLGPGSVFFSDKGASALNVF